MPQTSQPKQGCKDALAASNMLIVCPASLAPRIKLSASKFDEPFLCGLLSMTNIFIFVLLSHRLNTLPPTEQAFADFELFNFTHFIGFQIKIKNRKIFFHALCMSGLRDNDDSLLQ